MGEERVGRLEDHEVGDGRPERATVDAIADSGVADPGPHFVDDAGEVVPEAGRQGDPEPRGGLGSRGEAPVHRVQPGGRDAHTHLTGPGVWLGDFPQFEHLGTAELLVDDRSAHEDLLLWDLVPSPYTH